MNRTDFPGGGGVGVCGGGKAFKGIENFLKRVAFNLGNSPSQTEVKIISCIPIDVSDLQQKILHLERQLEEAKCCNARSNSSQRRIVSTALCDTKFPTTSHTGISCNSVDMDRGTNPQNTNTKNSSKKKSNVSFVVPSMNPQDDISLTSQPTYGPSITDEKRYREILPYDNDIKPFSSHLKQREGRKNFFKKKKKILKSIKPKTRYVYYAQTSSSPFNKSDAADEAPKDKILTRSYLAEMIKKQYKPRPLGGNLSDISKFSSPICRDQHDFTVDFAYESDICSCCHGTFHNTDNHTTKCHYPQVYRANVTKGGYYDSTLYDVVPVKEKPVKIKKTFDMPKKREPKPLIDIKCWPEDVRRKLCTYPIYNPLYADCYNLPSRAGDYVRREPKINRRQPVVKNVTKRKKELYNMDTQVDMETSKSCYIDFGTVYPKLINRKPKADKCIEVARVPRKSDAECFTNVINNSACQTATNTNDLKELNLADDRTEEMLNQIKTILQSVLQEVKVTTFTKNNANEKLKKDAIIQKGISQGNVASNMPSNVQGALQSSFPGSLQESFPGVLPGSIPNNLQGSRLLNSFTYSPYNMNPYLPSCSKHLNSNQYYYPPPTLKCFQNFPLFIQNPGRHMCASCYRHCSPVKSNFARPAATTATNTDAIKEEHSKETEKLIKEIYKSMALNIGVVNRDNSLIMSEYDTQDFGTHVSTKKITEKPQTLKEAKKTTNVVQAVSELFRKKDMVISSESPNTTTESRLVSNEVSTGSQLVTTTTDVEVKLRKDRLDKFLNQSKHGQSDENRQEKRKMHCTGTQNAMSETASDSETSSSDTDTDVTYVPNQTKQASQREKKEKKGLFSKMFKSVFKQKDRKRDTKSETPENEESSTDSDDYQTIYSQKIEAATKHTPRAHNLTKRRTHSKISYKQAYQRDKSPEKLSRRSPYMEQEYRRHWNENLTFHDYKYRYSSDHPYSVEPPRRSPYYQTYEARPAVVDPRNTHPRIETVNARRLVQTKPEKIGKTEPRVPAKGLAWLKKHKMGIHCGEQWKKLILEG